MTASPSRTEAEGWSIKKVNPSERVFTFFILSSHRAYLMMLTSTRLKGNMKPRSFSC